MARHYLPAWWRLSRALVLPRPCVREKCGKNAGKMFFTLHANIISACGKNVFYIIDRHPPEAAGAARRKGTPCGRRHGLRPTPTACGRSHGLTAERPAGERATPCRARIVPRNQEPGRRRGGGKSCTSIKTAGPCCWRARSCCPCRCPGSGSGLWLLLRPWLLRLGICLGSALLVIGSRPGVPEHCEAVLGARAGHGPPTAWA